MKICIIKSAYESEISIEKLIADSGMKEIISGVSAAIEGFWNEDEYIYDEGNFGPGGKSKVRSADGSLDRNGFSDCMNNISDSNLIIFVPDEDGNLSDDQMFLSLYAERLGKAVVHLPAILCNWVRNSDEMEEDWPFSDAEPGSDLLDPPDEEEETPEEWEEDEDFDDSYGPGFVVSEQDNWNMTERQRKEAERNGKISYE